MSCRTASVTRHTDETKIKVHLAIDGSGGSEVDSGIRMFDHFLTQIARHGIFDLKVEARGDDQHHTVEDVAICLGRAFNEALGEKRGIVRMANALVPMDEALSSVAVDLSGRGAAYITASFNDSMIGDLEADMVRHFLMTFASEGRLTLHARVEYGLNDHHKAESLFKALGRALEGACRLDSRRGDDIPSSKGVLER
ncbi:MAG: imidazoleglycerol-phosphate dehydratase HisB [Dehalococcoidia bacterium]|nr:MAG: imidazoleglycerol-phosphate dehydratase HisB [Dehalococcoidia bacterium]